MLPRRPGDPHQPPAFWSRVPLEGQYLDMGSQRDTCRPNLTGDDETSCPSRAASALDCSARLQAGSSDCHRKQPAGDLRCRWLGASVSLSCGVLRVPSSQLTHSCPTDSGCNAELLQKAGHHSDPHQRGRPSNRAAAVFSTLCWQVTASTFEGIPGCQQAQAH